MKWRYPILISAGLCCSACGFLYRPFPLPGDDPMLDLVLYHTPNFYTWIVWWYYLAPAAAVIVGGLLLISVWRVWFSSWGVGMPNIGMLPQWPLSPDKDAGPAIVVGEVHHPVKAVESRNPKWLTIPERGLYTGVAIFGAVGVRQNLGLHAPIRQSKSCPGRQAIPSAGRLAWCWKSKAISAMTSGECWPNRAVLCCHQGSESFAVPWTRNSAHRSIKTRRRSNRSERA